MNFKITKIANEIDKFDKKELKELFSQIDFDILSDIYEDIKKLKDSNNFEKSEKQLIESCKPIFDLDESINAIPIQSWGILYKYEGRGKKYEDSIGERSVKGFKYQIDNDEFNFEYLIKYEKQNYYSFCELTENIVIFSEKELVENYGDYEKGGNCIVVVKNKDCSFKIQCVSCDSPE